jgi:serine/threonine protein kinase
MNNIYKNKYEKYKNKYILLKQKIQEGGLLKFIGSGTSGCLICPPPAMSAMSAISAIPKNDNSFKISDFSFDKYKLNNNECEYVAKILAIQEEQSQGDKYEDELEQILKIQKLDPDGKYTPQLIYADIHTKKELQEIIKPDDIAQIAQIAYNSDSDSDKAYKCINDKIESNEFGYIISKHTGISLLAKYVVNETIETDMQKLKEFLIKFKELFSFIKILYDNSFLHLDIKIDNITVKENENNKLYLIDFGRTVELKDNDKYNKIINLLKQNHYMYSFEPKIYYNLLKKLNEELSFKELINYIEENFKSLIDPYDYNSKDEDTYMDILKKILDKININTEDQKEYFINYLEECYSKFCYNKFKLLAKNVEENMWKEYQEKIEKIYENYKIDKNDLLNFIFYPIIKRYDIYSMGIVLAEIVLFSHNFDDCDEIFKEQFIELIKNLLFNKFYDVSVIISEIDELQKLIQIS